MLRSKLETRDSGSIRSRINLSPCRTRKLGITQIGHHQSRRQHHHDHLTPHLPLITPHSRQYEDVRRLLQRRKDLPWKGAQTAGQWAVSIANRSSAIRVNSTSVATTKSSDSRMERANLFSFSARIPVESPGPFCSDDNTRRVSQRLVISSWRSSRNNQNQYLTTRKTHRKSPRSVPAAT
jgi:hypothetical protein